MTNSLHNQSTTDLADEYGTLDLQEKALAKRKSEIKAELIARDVDTVEAVKFTVTLSTQVSKRLDTTALKAALGEDICAEYEKSTESTVVRVKRTVVFGQSVAA